MSGSEPGEMAPKSSQVVVLPKFDELREAVTEYCILADLHPRLPPPDLIMDKLPSRCRMPCLGDISTHNNEGDVELLAEFPIPFHPPQHLLYVCGLTTACRHPELSYIIKDPEGKGNKYD
ncbi:hypothetical protein Tco_0100906, partial [Tanacetum coccineum]